MYKTPKMPKTKISAYNVTDGETLEDKIDRMVNNKEPMNKEGAPIIYTERKEGVKAGYNIRTDRWDVAIDGMDKVHKSAIARREESQKARAKAAENEGNDGKPESTQGTE